MTPDFSLANAHITVIGLGYVGLPLAVEFAKQYKVTGFDINVGRIAELTAGYDRTKEVNDEDLAAVLKVSNEKGLTVSNSYDDISQSNIYIVTVPTPVDKYNRPDLKPLYKASKTVGTVIKDGDIVIYESTVYPGVTEDECVPVIEQVSGMKYNEDFFVGYSPERINPGDKEHTLIHIKKVTSGSTPEVADLVDELYNSIVIAGTHKAPSIRVAEAAKIIENSQRDINIAFVNELSKIFTKLDIDTRDVLDAAGTKWNFLKFSPGLVGGHCIGVDPYYLAQKAQEMGYHPEIILAGRKLNDGMGEYIAHEVVKLMVKKDIPVKNAQILVMGITFKENCPDVRNTRVIDIVNTLKEYHADVLVYDPLANCAEVEHEYGIKCVNALEDGKRFDTLVLAVAHDAFRTLDVNTLCNSHKVIYDVKSVLPKGVADARL
ncbi:nucleotide sugar dehydrogenase [Mucilaginibacter limnophilus]|uniref:Nucleotide sugar dehydrogenase n=1 Tax=Mucilaginibacter limnophilus TaxID=1932778 RepID=A0A3S3TGU6_9SPHI|nr:nucleotide sugar dehydrogenase [Mucilaginibacter limnophilus]RVU00718.1 nucleotide sugar dehydrogenase [Mucilaginibacter limnophilus]